MKICSQYFSWLLCGNLPGVTKCTWPQQPSVSIIDVERFSTKGILDAEENQSYSNFPYPCSPWLAWFLHALSHFRSLLSVYITRPSETVRGKGRTVSVVARRWSRSEMNSISVVRDCEGCRELAELHACLPSLAWLHHRGKQHGKLREKKQLLSWRRKRSEMSLWMHAIVLVRKCACVCVSVRAAFSMRKNVNE